MKGILLISHGAMAEGVKETTEIFFGKNIEQFAALGLQESESAESFRERLFSAVAELDKGDGVLVFADLFGGTPCNQCAFLDSKQCHVIAGMNLPMVMESLACRQTEADFSELLQKFKESIVDFTALIETKKKRR